MLTAEAVVGLLIVGFLVLQEVLIFADRALRNWIKKWKS